MTRKARTDRNTGLDLLRALAIMLTFFVHVIWIIGGWRYGRDFEYLSIRDANTALEGTLIWLYHSQHGVFLFFVLSGFLMGKKWFGARPPRLLEYLKDRAWRTLPGAWLAISAAVALMAAAGKLPPDTTAKWIENLFFLNWFRKADTHHLLVVTWSLHAEWLFYLMLPVVAWIASRIAQTKRIAAWQSVALVVFLLCIAFKFMSLRGAAYALFFAVGVIAAIEQTRLRPLVTATPWWVIVGLYGGANFIYGWLSATAARTQTNLWNAFDTHAMVFAFTATLMLLKATDTHFPDLGIVRAGRYIGKISYSIYLWHLLVLLALGQWFGWPAAMDNLPSSVAVALYAATSIAATWCISALSFRWIEQPYFNRRAREATLKAP